MMLRLTFVRVLVGSAAFALLSTGAWAAPQMEEAGQAAQQATETTQEAAQQATETTKEAGQQAVDTTKETAQEAAGAVTGEEEVAEEKTENLDPAQQVLSRIHRVNMMTVEAGELAQKNAESKKVKSLAKDVADTQKKWDKEVTKVAKEADIKFVEPTPLDEQDREFMSRQNAVMARLRDTKGKDFDRLYLTALINRRENVIPILKEMQPQIVDQKVKAKVSKSIEAFQDQLDRAKKLMGEEFPAGT